MKKPAYMRIRLTWLLIYAVTCVLLTCGFVTCARAQQGPTQEQKLVLFNKIDTLTRNYIQLSTLLERGKSAITPAAQEKFADLFASRTVNIPDEMEPAYFDHTASEAGFPSYDALDQQAATLRTGLPAFTDADGGSMTKLKTYQSQLDAYNHNFNDQRPQFYAAYESMNSKIRDYQDAQVKQESIHKRSLNDFFAMTAGNYPDGFSVRLLNSTISFKNIARYEVDVVLVKRVSGTVKSSGLKLENVDTVVLILETSTTYNRVAIGGIEMRGHHYSFLNDKDRDFVTDSRDACPDDRGFQANGCPFPAEKGYAAKMSGYLDERAKDSTTLLADQQAVKQKMTELQARIDFLNGKIKDPAYWWLTLGGQAGTISATTTDAAPGYNGYINATGIYNNPNTKFTSGNFFGGDLAVEHYFGKAANVGLSLGVSFLSISGTVGKSAFQVEYQAKDKGQNLYRQIIMATTPLSEKVGITNIAIPVLFIFKTNPSSKDGSGIGFKLEVGAALNVQYQSTMSGSPQGTFNYEAVYAYGTGTNTNPPRFFDGANPAAATSWVIAPPNASSAETYLNALKSAGYPVGYGITAAGMTTQNKTASFGSGYSVLIRPSVTYFINKGSYLSLGAYFSYNSLSQSGSGYEVVDESQSKYTTLMQGISKLTTNNIGIRLSYSHSLFYNVPKWTRELSGLQ